MDAGIGKLDSATQNRIRSSQIITSLPQIVSELLQNALDAGATSIEIGIDPQEWLCWVKDNGWGVRKDCLDAVAQEGYAGRYSTSKVHAPNLMNAESTFGFRGEALTSIADVACLEVASRTSQSKETWAIIMKGGKRLYSGPAVRWRREVPGTVVCVRDVFYNLPVRRTSHPSSLKTWDSVRQEAERYALVFPHVGFTLENLHESRQVALAEGRLYRIVKTQSMLATFRKLYGRALAERVEEISISRDDVKIGGFISLLSSNSKNYQFLYVNRHYMEPDELHRAINSWFSGSTFGRTALNEEGERDFPGSAIRRSPRKAEKRPVYCLNISIPPSDVDNCLEPGKSAVHLKNQNSVIRILSSVIHKFLETQGFLPSTSPLTGRAHDPRENGNSPRKRKRADALDNPAFEAADVSGQPRPSNRLPKREGTPPEPLISVGGEMVPFHWTDPRTGEVFTIDSRTGNTSKQWGRMTAQGLGDAQTDPFCGTKAERITKRRGANVVAGPYDIPSWLSCALKTNNAYPRIEKRLAAPPCELPPAAYSKPGSQEDRHVYGAGSDWRGKQISRRQLLYARVVGQIDKKFVGCLLNPYANAPPFTAISPDTSLTRAKTLILVDQHAADERVRVESFLGPLCLGFLRSRSGRIDSEEPTPEEPTPITRLTPPCPVLLARHEVSLLNGNACVRDLFRRWGISFQDYPAKGSHRDSSIGSSGDFEQVFVTSLPEVLSDKLLQNNELQSLLRDTLGEIQSGTLPIYTLPTPSSQVPEERNNWLPALRWCPRSLVDLINSKACRGAIMFNDELSIEQCERLISQLAQTAFPFQCAHGRPSLIPLTDVNVMACAPSPRRLCEWKGLEQ